MKTATAVAHSNIALAKYWGKADSERMLAAVPSLSMTLEALHTRTTVTFDAAIPADEVLLGDSPAQGRARSRVVALLDRVRRQSGLVQNARVVSTNNFPTAAGLASSASGFAALAVAAAAASGLSASGEELSSLARQSSVSAARSIYGGFVALGAGAEFAERVAPAESFEASMVIALTAAGAKAVGSSEGMDRTARTSPYYQAWVEHAPAVYERARRAIIDQNLEALGEAMEESALMMHASMFAARPALVYFTPATLAAMERVRALRTEGVPAFFTMDAGPHVKVLTRPSFATRVADALADTPGVLSVLVSRVGPDASVEPS